MKRRLKPGPRLSPGRRPVLLLATHNRHKVTEIRRILARVGLRWQIKTMQAYPTLKPVVEDRATLEGNAAKKAREIAKKTGLLTLSDDTGLFVDALQGRPGVYSARFAGPGCDFDDNNRKILRLMKRVPAARRGATFRCVAALALPSGQVTLAKGALRGVIVPAKRGEHGFGYDPIFLVPRYNQTFAEMTRPLKNRISHRAQAFSKVPALLARAKKTHAA